LTCIEPISRIEGIIRIINVHRDMNCGVCYNSGTHYPCSRAWIPVIDTGREYGCHTRVYRMCHITPQRIGLCNAYV